MGPTQAQQDALKAQKRQERAAQQGQIRTAQKDLQSQTNDIFRRFGTFTSMSGSAPISRM